jgi:hypothetical protein
MGDRKLLTGKELRMYRERACLDRHVLSHLLEEEGYEISGGLIRDLEDEKVPMTEELDTALRQALGMSTETEKAFTEYFSVDMDKLTEGEKMEKHEMSGRDMREWRRRVGLSLETIAGMNPGGLNLSILNMLRFEAGNEEMADNFRDAVYDILKEGEKKSGPYTGSSITWTHNVPTPTNEAESHYYVIIGNLERYIDALLHVVAGVQYAKDFDMAELRVWTADPETQLEKSKQELKAIRAEFRKLQDENARLKGLLPDRDFFNRQRTKRGLTLEQVADNLYAYGITCDLEYLSKVDRGEADLTADVLYYLGRVYSEYDSMLGKEKAEEKSRRQVMPSVELEERREKANLTRHELAQLVSLLGYDITSAEVYAMENNDVGITSELMENFRLVFSTSSMINTLEGESPTFDRMKELIAAGKVRAGNTNTEDTPPTLAEALEIVVSLLPSGWIVNLSFSKE